MAKLGSSWFWLAFVSLAIMELSSCNKRKLFDGPNSYNEDFEQSAVLSDYLKSGDSAWSFTQQTLPGNLIQLDNTLSTSGSQCMKFIANPTSSTLSKSSISKQNFAFWEKETMCVEADYRIQGNDPLEWLFLLDLEEKTAIGAGPGMRLALVGNQLRYEFKFNQPDVTQNAATSVDFPRDQWVHLKVEVYLHHKKKGSLKVWQDNVWILEKDGIKTLPKDLLFVQQGTKKMYNSVEIGATANPSSELAVVYVDNLKVYKK